MLLVGYALGKLGELVHLPEITGFIVAGLLIGPTVTGIVGSSAATDVAVINALAIILFGAVSGYSIHRATRSTRAEAATVIIMTSGVLFLTTAVSVAAGLSPLLLTMAAGSILARG